MMVVIIGPAESVLLEECGLLNGDSHVVVLSGTKAECKEAAPFLFEQVKLVEAGE